MARKCRYMLGGRPCLSGIHSLYENWCQPCRDAARELCKSALGHLADMVANKSTEHGAHNVGRKFYMSREGYSDVAGEITDWNQGWFGPEWGTYIVKDTKGREGVVLQSDFSNGQAHWIRKHARDCDGKPCECGANPPPKLPVWQAFAKVWAQAKLDPAIDEEAWENLQNEILALIYRDAKDCSECITLREEGVGPYYCVQHMK